MLTQQEIRTIFYDERLGVEACRFQGLLQPFPNHFHDYYVVGLVASGERILTCKSREYAIRPGHILLFNPGDSHGCTQCGQQGLDWLGLNLPKPVMLRLAEEITGERILPGFSQNVVEHQGLDRVLRGLHRSICGGGEELEREELLLLLISQLLELYGQPFPRCIPPCSQEVERACAYMDANFARRVTLEQLCAHSCLSKSALLRAFAKAKGVTPYRYLQALRISRAKELLRQGTAPADAAIQTGFSDQSHFSNFFHLFTGLTPAAYGRIFQNTDGKEEKT